MPRARGSGHLPRPPGARAPRRDARRLHARAAEVMGERLFHGGPSSSAARRSALRAGAPTRTVMKPAYAGRDVDLYQHNIVETSCRSSRVEPRLRSVVGQHLHNGRRTRADQPVHVPAASLFDAEGRPGGLTGTYRQGSCEGGSVVRPTRVDVQIALARRRIAGGHGHPQRAAGHGAAAPLAARPQGDACVTWHGDRARRRPAPTTS